MRKIIVNTPAPWETETPKEEPKKKVVKKEVEVKDEPSPANPEGDGGSDQQEGV